MTAEEFKAACEPYLYRGTMTVVRNPINYEDNPHYFTAWEFKVLKRLGGEDLEREVQYISHLNACLTPHGIPDRDPEVERAEKIAHEEIVAVAAYSRIDAYNFRLHGERNAWSLDNRVNGFTFRGFLPIRLYPVAFIYARTCKRPPLLAELLYALDCLTTPLKLKGKTSGRMQLLFVSDEMLASKSPLCRWATRYFLRSLEKQYGTWDGLFQIYFPGHPFTEAVKGWRFV